MISYATIEDFDKIKEIFKKYRHLFPHVRQDYIRSMITKKQCVLEKDVVIFFTQYKRSNKIGSVVAPKNSWTVKQIVALNQGDGSAKEVLENFLSFVNDDVYLSVRADNDRARRFYRKLGFEQVGTISWKSGLIDGCVYVWRNNKTTNVFT